MGELDKDLADQLSAQLHRARRELEGLMVSHGLLASEGWRVHEELVNTDAGMAYRLRPIHRVQTSPPALEVRIPVRN